MLLTAENICKKKVKMFASFLTLSNELKVIFVTVIFLIMYMVW